MYEVQYDRRITGRPTGIKRLRDSASIPLTADNTDFAEFLEWNKTGGLDWQTPITPDPPTPAELRQKAAKGEAALATALKAVTPAQAVAYIETNVTNLASAKAVMKIMVRMLIALRDNAWPELPDV